jgi:3-methyladenine DNA glycosylase AlkD
MWQGRRVDVRTLADEVDAALRARAVPERAERERAYLKSDLEHFGVSMPAIRAVARDVRGRRPDLSHRDLVALVEALWAVPVHERRMVAVELLEEYDHLLDRAHLPLLERLLRESRTWALVDGLAPSVVGPIVDRDPVAADVLDRWATDDDFWIRRAALLSLLIPLRQGAGDFDRFARYADSMLEEREFFIRKAIGWVLPRAARASGVTVREVLKPLSESQRAAIQAARTTG